MAKEDPKVAGTPAADLPSHEAFKGLAEEQIAVPARRRGRPTKDVVLAAGTSIVIPGPVTITRETLRKYAQLLEQIESVGV